MYRNFLAFLFFAVLSLFCSTIAKSEMNPQLKEYILRLPEKQSSITEERKEELNELREFIQNRINENKNAEIIFICTHNSRRSHFSQVWAQTLAYYFGIKNVKCYSGGIEVTAFNPRAVNALIRSGFATAKIEESSNPIYKVYYSDREEPVIGYSKLYNDGKTNPTKDFAAVMTCSHADAACPIVYGAEDRISLPYDDPKEFDGKPEETEAYDKTCLLIACELYYVFSNLKK